MGEWRGHALVRREVERREVLEFAGMKVIGDVEEGGGRPEVLEVRRSAKGCDGWAAESFPRRNPFVLPATRCTLNYKRTLLLVEGITGCWADKYTSLKMRDDKYRINMSVAINPRTKVWHAEACAKKFMGCPWGTVGAVSPAVYPAVSPDGVQPKAELRRPGVPASSCQTQPFRPSGFYSHIQRHHQCILMKSNTTLPTPQSKALRT